MSKLFKYAFSDLYDISSGISSTKDQAGHGTPFASFRTVFNNIFLPDKLPDLMEVSEKEQKIYSIKKGDILITRTSETVDELAMSCVALKDYPQASYSGFVKRLRPKTEGIVYDRFMAFFLRSKYFRKVIECNTIMTLRASFNEDIFSFLDLYLPDYETQKRIGDLLYHMERKRENNAQINDNLQQQLRLLYDYWFTQFDFPDENGKPYRSSGGAMVWNSTLKAEIPLGWTVGVLSDCIAKVSTGLNPRDNFKLGNGSIRYITVKNLTMSGVLDFSGCDTIDETAQTLIHRRSDISKGDILFASIAPLGRCYLIEQNPTDWEINESVFSIRPNIEMTTAEFLYSYFTSPAFIKGATSSSTGSVFKGIRINTLLDTKVLIPPYRIASAFSAKVRGLFSMLDKNAAEISTLSGIRDWLLPMLMNGQATISD